MNLTKILVLGYFGYVTNQLDGQTIKTRNVYNLIESRSNKIGVISHFDTQQFQQSKFSVLTMIWELVKVNKLVYLPAHNNLRYLFPILFLICKIFRIEILYFVIGGWLFDYLLDKPIHRFLLKKITKIFPENSQLEKLLEFTFGFKNLQTLPNFRVHNFKPNLAKEKKSYRIVFMARINRMKGIEVIFKIAEYFENNSIGPKKVSIDFYGTIDKNDEELFLANISRHPITTYKGTLAPENIYYTLSKYDVMILPTKYYTEGFPGSILDAYIAGIPVIVTHWKHALEFVDHAKSGFVVPFENGEQEIKYKLTELYNNEDLLYQMKKNAYEKSKEYSSESVWKIIEPYLK